MILRGDAGCSSASDNVERVHDALLTIDAASTWVAVRKLGRVSFFLLLWARNREKDSFVFFFSVVAMVMNFNGRIFGNSCAANRRSDLQKMKNDLYAAKK